MKPTLNVETTANVRKIKESVLTNIIFTLNVLSENGIIFK